MIIVFHDKPFFFGFVAVSVTFQLILILFCYAPHGIFYGSAIEYSSFFICCMLAITIQAYGSTVSLNRFHNLNENAIPPALVSNFNKVTFPFLFSLLLNLCKKLPKYSHSYQNETSEYFVVRILYGNLPEDRINVLFATAFFNHYH